jgi:recombination associated protein RdgC
MNYVVNGLPDDAVARFAKHAAPPLQKIGNGAVNGWVGGRHFFDLPISDENAFLGGYLRLTLLRAERKVPASLLRAECMLEEFAYMRAENKPFVDRKMRGEIKKEVMNRLLPQMPPTLQGIPFVYDERGGIIYTGATSQKQMDAFRARFQMALGVDLIPVNAATIAAHRRNVNVRDWPRTSFSPEVPDTEMDDAPGADFLTWLWFLSEARGGILRNDELGEFAVAIEGPLLLTRTGSGAHETALRQGLPTASAEAKTALLGGKKLERAKLMFGRGDEAWSCAFDAEAFVFRSLKLPQPKETLDPASRFQDRMQKMGLFRDVLFALYDRFLDDRCNAKKWSATKKEIHKWAADRTTKL